MSFVGSGEIARIVAESPIGSVNEMKLIQSIPTHLRDVVEIPSAEILALRRRGK